MDQILMKGLQFYGYHGVLEAEKFLGQKFTVHVVVDCDLMAAGIHDDLNKTVSYAELYKIVEDMVTKKRFNLIEALAEHIARALLKFSSNIIRVQVEVEKPEAPVHGIYSSFGVKIERFQHD
jgi:dihydroneopterin aldolase